MRGRRRPATLSSQMTGLTDRVAATLSRRTEVLAIRTRTGPHSSAQSTVTLAAKRKPRVLQVSAYYPPHLGGQEVVVQELATQMASIGEDIEVVTSDRGSHRGRTEESGVSVTRLRSLEIAHSPLIFGLLWWLIRNVRRDTIVHLHFGQLFASEMVWIASKLIGFSYIMHLHGELAPSGPMGTFLPLYRKLFFVRELRDASFVIVLNDAQKLQIAERYGRHESVAVMRNGLKSEFFRAARRGNQSAAMELVYVGRLSPPKNVNSLIEALRVADTRVKLHIIGDGECRRSLEAAARAVPAGSAVIFHGRLSRNEIIGFYATCDGFVLPSLYEAQPLVLLEAMACRIPVVVTNVGGLEGLTSCTVMVQPSVEGLAAGIDRLARMSPERRDDLVRRAFRQAQRHEWSRVLSSYTQLYRSLCVQS